MTIHAAAGRVEGNFPQRRTSAASAGAKKRDTECAGAMCPPGWKFFMIFFDQKTEAYKRLEAGEAAYRLQAFPAPVNTQAGENQLIKIYPLLNKSGKAVERTVLVAAAHPGHICLPREEICPKPGHLPAGALIRNFFYYENIPAGKQREGIVLVPAEFQSLQSAADDKRQPGCRYRCSEKPGFRENAAPSQEKHHGVLPAKPHQPGMRVSDSSRRNEMASIRENGERPLFATHLLVCVQPCCHFLAGRDS